MEKIISDVNNFGQKENFGKKWRPNTGETLYDSNMAPAKLD